MEALEQINKLLNEAGDLLNKAAEKVRDDNFNSEQNVKLIGDALTRIFEVRLQIFEHRPDLKPDYLDS